MTIFFNVTTAGVNASGVVPHRQRILYSLFNYLIFLQSFTRKFAI